MTDQFEISQALQKFLDDSPAKAVSRLENALSNKQTQTIAAGDQFTYLILSNEIVLDTPLAYYRVNETTGTVATDSSGNTLHGTYVNGPTLGEPALLAVPPGGAQGTSVLFDGGAATYLSMPTHASLNITGPLTVEFLMKSTSGDFDVILGGFDFAYPHNGYGVSIGYLLPGVLYYHKDDTWYPSTVTLNDGVVHHVVVTASATAVTFTVDGAAAGMTAIDARPSSYSGQRNWGASSQPGSHYDGWLDEMAIYAGVLSDSRIASHYAAATAAQVL
jgi:hypothetical protein